MSGRQFKSHRTDIVKAFGPAVAEVINAYGEVLFRRGFLGRLKWLVFGR